MKNLILLLLFFLVIFPLINNTENNISPNKNSEPNENDMNADLDEDYNNNNYENDSVNLVKEEEEIDSSTPDGYYMSDKTFDKKLKKVLEKRNLKPKKKITKDILKKIFIEIYKKDNVDLSDMSEEEAAKKIESDDKMMNQVFENVARSLDYDDKIKVSQIKEWICPKRTQDGLNEIMDRMMDYL